MTAQKPTAKAANSRKQAAMNFLRQCAAGKARETFRAHVTPGFRHHNPYFRGDAETLAAAMDDNAKQSPEKVFEIQRALEDGDLVAVHSRVRMKPGDPDIAVVHILRFENDRVAELWDIAVPVPKDSPNKHGMF
jgi:predicted SnoaL-like aldol condensation-catalyzing enzyme